MSSLIEAATPTMSSREIADLVESRPADVCRAIERLMLRGAISGYAPMAYTHPQNGQQYTEYRVCKRDSYVIVAQLSPEFTARLVDRWQELEVQAATLTVPQTFAEALRLAADKAEEIERQAAQLEAQKPAVEFAQAVRNTNDAISISQMAAVLGIGRNRFYSMLRADHVLMADNLPYQHYKDRGYFRVIESVWVDDAKEPHPTFKTLVTGRGQVYLQRKYCAQSEPQE